MMNKKIDIENLEKRNPYRVSKDYFTSLTHNIMEKIEEKETNTFFDFFTFKTLTPTFTMLLIIFSIVWYNNQNPNITDEDLVELLTFYDVEDELLLEFIELEQEETIDDDLLNECNYNELIYEL